MSKPFVTNKDYIELDTNDVTKKDIYIFLNEIVDFFNQNWQEKYLINEYPKSLEDLNKTHLLDYPSIGGYHILEDTFCQVDTSILSDKSISLLGYFYGIQLR